MEVKVFTREQYGKVSCTGIHQIVEETRDLENAFENAERDDFQTIYFYLDKSVDAMAMRREIKAMASAYVMSKEIGSFENNRIYLRDVSQAHYEQWKGLDRQWNDALTWKQYKAIHGGSTSRTYVQTYERTKLVSKSRKVLDLAWLVAQARQIYDIAAAEYLAHLKTDPELITLVLKG